MERVYIRQTGGVMSGLEEQNVPISFNNGVDSKSDPKQVMPTKVITLQNGVVSQTPGEFRKRPGQTPLTNQILGGGGLTGVTGLFAYNDELVATTTSSLYSYSESTPAWVNKGTYVPLSVTTQNVGESPTGLRIGDGIYDAVSGYTAYAWLTPNASGTYIGYYSIRDSVTGAVVVTGTLYNGTTQILTVKTLLQNSKFVFLLYVASTTSIKYQTVATATPASISAAADLPSLTDIASPAIFDACVDSNILYVIYTYASGIKVRAYDTSFANTATKTTATVSTAVTIFCESSTGRVFVTYADGTNVYCIVYSSGLAAIVNALQTVATGSAPTALCGIVVSNVATIFITFPGTDNSTNSTAYVTISVGGSFSAVTTVAYLSLASKPFAIGSGIYVAFIYSWLGTGSPPATSEATIFLYRLVPGVVSNGLVAKWSAGLLQQTPPSIIPGNFLPEVSTTASGVFTFPFLQGDQSILTAGTISYTFGLTAVSLNFNVQPTGVVVADSLHLSGGMLWQYDGVNIVEHGFHLYPENITTAATSGGNLSAGSYEYVAVYQWLDANGLLHRSQPSLPVTISVSASDKVTLTVANLRVTQKTNAQYPVSIMIYRTLVNSSSPFFRLTTPGSLINSTALASSGNYVDTLSDVNLAGRDEMYTTGGVVDNTSAPPVAAVTSYRSRLVVIPSDNPESWWYSKEILPTSGATFATPVELADLFVNGIDPNGGAIYAVGTMDDKLVFFRESTIYYEVGNGPANNGTSSDYQPPQIIVSPVGCSNPASVVLMPDGLMFQASNSGGIWLLTRSLDTRYVGIDFEAFNSYTVTSAVLMPDYNQVRFTTSDGSCLVYDYTLRDERGYGKWSQFLNYTCVDAVVWQGKHTIITSGGVASQETPGAYLDNGVGYSLVLKTAWMKFAGLQGFQRLYRMLVLGEYKSAHGLQVQVSYDFNSTVAQTTAVVTNSTAPYEYRVNFQRQKCTALQLTIQDTTPVGESMSLSGITFLVGVRSKPNRMAPTRSFG